MEKPALGGLFELVASQGLEPARENPYRTRRICGRSAGGCHTFVRVILGHPHRPDKPRSESGMRHWNVLKG
jgi:hypothetical protein